MGRNCNTLGRIHITLGWIHNTLGRTRDTLGRKGSSRFRSWDLGTGQFLGSQNVTVPNGIDGLARPLPKIQTREFGFSRVCLWYWFVAVFVFKFVCGTGSRPYSFDLAPFALYLLPLPTTFPSQSVTGPSQRVMDPSQSVGDPS